MRHVFFTLNNSKEELYSGEEVVAATKLGVVIKPRNLADKKLQLIPWHNIHSLMFDTDDAEMKAQVYSR